MSDTELQVRISAKLDELKSGLSQVNAEVSGLGNKMAGGMDTANAGIARLASSVTNLIPQMLALKVAYEGIQAVAQQFAAGIKFNSQMEQARLGIATLITAQADLKDASGKAVTGQDALTQAIKLSDDQMQKLRIAGLQTSATTQQLAEAFQQAVGAGMAAGLNLDQIRQLTVQITQAAGALGVPMNQLNQEVVSILNGTIDMNSRVAKSLGLSNEMVNSWKQQGKLVEELSKRMDAFSVAGAETAKTWEATKSNIAEARDTMMGMITSGFFEKIKESANNALSGIFDVNNATIGKDLKGFVDFASDAFTGIGEMLATAIQKGVEAFKEMSQWIDHNQELLNSMLALFDQILGVAKPIAETIMSWSSAILSVLPSAQTLNATFATMALSVAKIRDMWATITQESSMKMPKAVTKNYDEALAGMANPQGVPVSSPAAKAEPKAMPSYTPKPVAADTKGADKAKKEAERAAERARKARERSIEQELTLAEQEAQAEEEIARRAERLKESLAEQGFQHRRELGLQEIDAAEEQAQFERQIGIKSEADMLKDLKKFEDQRYKIKKEELLAEQKLYVNDYKYQAKIKQDLEKLERQHANKQKQIQRDGLASSMNIYKDIFGSIKQAFSYSIQGMIQGTLTLKDALANIGQSILAQFVQLGVDMLASWIEKQIAMMIFSESTQAADVAATAAGNVMKAESNAAVAAVAAAQSVAAIPVIGWAMAPGVAATTFASMQPYVALASAAGGFDIPAGVNPLTQLHEKEMVLPAKHADVIRGLADNGGPGQSASSVTNVHFNISAVDGASVKKLIMSNGHHIAAAITAQQRNGNNYLRGAMA